MKRKSLFIPGAALIKWHAVIYIVFIIALWWSALSTFNYPGNADLPFSMFKAMILNNIGLTMLWGFVFLIHFMIYQTRVWAQQRARQRHLKTVNRIQDRYLTHSRLDLESPTDNEDEIVDEENWHTQERLQSKS